MAKIKFFMIGILIFLIGGASVDAQVSNSLCGPEDPEDCPSGFERICWEDDEGDYYFTCEYQSDSTCDNPSYSLDCSRQCTEPGHIFQYNYDVCCPPTFPFYNPSDDLCYTYNIVGTDNYYTRHSECEYYEVSKCEETDYYICQTESYITNFVYQGKIRGQCGVECLDGDENCAGENDKIFYTCTPDNTWGEQGAILGKCNVNCLADIDCNVGFECKNYNCVEVEKIIVYRMQENKCTEISIYPNERTSDDYDNLELCEANISEPFPIWIIGAIIAIAGGLYLMYKKLR